MSYRHQVRIVSDVLLAVKEGHEEGVGIAQLMRKANISYVRVTKILNELISVGLIEEIKNERSTKYKITYLGIEYLSEYERFSTFAKSFGLEI
jgi:predicted transcriptional regulator